MSGVTSTWFAPPPPVYNIISCPSRETHTWKERKTEKDRVEEKKGGEEGGGASLPGNDSSVR